MATVTFRGKAAFEGVAGAFDVIVYPLQQTGKTTYNFEEEIVKDVHGFDTAWLGRNAHMMGDWGFKLLGPTAANAVAGAAFLSPLAIVTLSGFGPTFLNTTWQSISGQDIDMQFDKVAGMSMKLRAYADGTQNTLAATTPS